MSGPRSDPPPAAFGDFTEAAYGELVGRAVERFAFEPFGVSATHPHVLWRHDVDISVHRAVALARIEAETGAASTWFFWLHSPFYSLLEPAIAGRAREILGLGHRLGLHFDPAAYPGLRDQAALEERIDYERQLLEGWLERTVEAVSLHNPDVRDVGGMREERLANLPNAYGSALEDGYEYVSDSNGYWRFRRLPDLLADETVSRLHVLTHPEWWTPEVLSPRERVVRSVEGRGRQVLSSYDALLARHDRINLR
jgi:hypothetical protein